MPAFRQIALTIVIALIAGLVGALAGPRLLHRSPAPSFHALLHQRLDLSEAQQARIEAIEQRFAIRRQQLEAEMRIANRELADAIHDEHGYGPRVTAAVDHFHMVMGRLQKETIEHVFAMRAVLNPEQAERFDQSVVGALTAQTQ